MPVKGARRVGTGQLWHAYTSRPQVGVSVDVPTVGAALRTRVFFRPVGFNGLAACWPMPASSRWSYSLPDGADVVAVVIQEQNGRLYYGTQRLTAATGLVAPPVLEALPAAGIVRRIRLL